ncbi:MAG: hypothetical protein WC365_01760 [Candidatus Babeliales bacterium]|jgi:FKBP-type peptidyl-prolyl cis-trans isomerase (trigger factor)
MCSDIQTSEVGESLALALPTPLPDTNKHENILTFIATKQSSHLLRITVEINQDAAHSVFLQTVELFKNGPLDGFNLKQASAEYVQEMYTEEIIGHTKDYFLHHLVIDFLINEIIARKIALVNYPRFISSESTGDKKIGFNFDVSIADSLELKEWKHFAFRSPKRKRYKDLDKQVCAFIENRHALAHKPNYTLAEEDDWVLFDATMLNNNLKPLHNGCCGSFWIKLGHQDGADSLSLQLFNKSEGTSFSTSSFSIYTPRHQSGECAYNFLITIKTIIKGSHSSLDVLKMTFKLKNKSDVHNKLMEIFSFRNDISQRQAIVEEVFHLLLSKHRFEVPKHLILRREEDIIATLTRQPDYHVYKAQIDFHASVEMLAEKQLKEEIIIDQIAYSENIRTDVKDITNYLYLLNSKRLKEFIYFKPILERIEETCTPINTSTLTQAVLREKTLNFIIHSLTK